MANRILHLRKHHPLITPRIEFRAAPPPPLPLLTPRIEFDPDRLVRSRSSSDEGREGFSNKRRRLSFSGRHANEDSDAHGDDPIPGETSVPSPSTLKPKPAGEPGKPGSGGFSLESVLINVHKWVKKDYDALYIKVKEEVNKTLDMTRSFKFQDKGKVQEICDKMQSRWPSLATYESCWPVVSMVKLALKYTSEASKRQKDKEPATGSARV